MLSFAEKRRRGRSFPKKKKSIRVEGKTQKLPSGEEKSITEIQKEPQYFTTLRKTRNLCVYVYLAHCLNRAESMTWGEGGVEAVERRREFFPQKRNETSEAG